MTQPRMILPCMTQPCIKQLRILPVLALCLAMAACGTLPGREGNVDAVLTASGLDAQLSRLQQPFPPGKTSGPSVLIPDEWLTIVNAAIADALKPDDIRQDLRNTLVRDMSSRELANVQDFYESDAGRHVVALESGNLSAPGATRVPDATLDELARTTGAGKAIRMNAAPCTRK